jgi:hypothetical protein
MPSQGIHAISRRSKTKSKQLEKVKEPKELERHEEEGVASVILDDLVEGGLGLINRGGEDYQGMGIFGATHRTTFQPLNKCKLDTGVITGQLAKRPMTDLSRPQRLIDPSAGELPCSTQPPKGITFDVMARKIDVLKDRGEPIDPVRLLHDLSF